MAPTPALLTSTSIGPAASTAAAIDLGSRPPRPARQHQRERGLILPHSQRSGITTVAPGSPRRTSTPPWGSRARPGSESGAGSLPDLGGRPQPAAGSGREAARVPCVVDDTPWLNNRRREPHVHRRRLEAEAIALMFAAWTRAADTLAAPGLREPCLTSSAPMRLPRYCPSARRRRCRRRSGITGRQQLRKPADADPAAPPAGREQPAGRSLPANSLPVGDALEARSSHRLRPRRLEPGTPPDHRRLRHLRSRRRTGGARDARLEPGCLPSG
jgi:hypothetical protein